MWVTSAYAVVCCIVHWDLKKCNNNKWGIPNKKYWLTNRFEAVTHYNVFLSITI